jgi:two-component system LytT family response regulator
MNDMTRLRIIVVDDEPLSRRGVRALLERHGDVEVAGEAGNGVEAVALIQRASADILFLDVQMPGLDGFGVLSSIDVDNAPLVVFITAYDSYAIQAFEQHAFDYLLKPVDPARFDLALDRARQRLKERAEGQIGRQLARLLASRASDIGTDNGPAHPDRITFRDGARVIVVERQEIEWIGAEDDYIRVHTPRKTYLIRETLSAVEQRLDGASFVRVHRSTIVNVSAVREVVQAANNDAVIVLRNGEKLRASRRYRDALASRFGL